MTNKQLNAGLAYLLDLHSIHNPADLTTVRSGKLEAIRLREIRLKTKKLLKHREQLRKRVGFQFDRDDLLKITGSETIKQVFSLLNAVDRKPGSDLYHHRIANFFNTTNRSVRNTWEYEALLTRLFDNLEPAKKVSAIDSGYFDENGTLIFDAVFHPVKDEAYMIDFWAHQIWVQVFQPPEKNGCFAEGFSIVWFEQSGSKGKCLRFRGLNFLDGYFFSSNLIGSDYLNEYWSFSDDTTVTLPYRYRLKRRSSVINGEGWRHDCNGIPRQWGHGHLFVERNQTGDFSLSKGSFLRYEAMRQVKKHRYKLYRADIDDRHLQAELICRLKSPDLRFEACLQVLDLAGVLGLEIAPQSQEG